MVEEHLDCYYNIQIISKSEHKYLNYDIYLKMIQVM